MGKGNNQKAETKREIIQDVSQTAAERTDDADPEPSGLITLSFNAALPIVLPRHR